MPVIRMLALLGIRPQEAPAIRAPEQRVLEVAALSLRFPQRTLLLATRQQLPPIARRPFFLQAILRHQERLFLLQTLIPQAPSSRPFLEETQESLPPALPLSRVTIL